jgi:hypothetical protein
MSTQVKKVSKIEEFKSALTDGINGIIKASEIYVSALDEDMANAEKFQRELADFVPASAWAQFEAVGRKWMHPRLLLGGVADRKKASIIKRMPYSLQERVFNHERFKLLTANGETLSVDVMEITADQADQLCNGTAIRSLPEQRAWLEAQKKNTPVEEVELMPYVLTDGKVTFRRGCVLNRNELKRLLQEM